MNQNETIADILHEIRTRPQSRPSPTDIREWANRLEAAAARDRAITDVMLAVKDKPLPHPDPEHAPPLFPGNAAAMREALVKMVDAVKAYFGWDDAPAVHDLNGPDAFFCREMSKAIAALAAPARNCDRFKTAEEALAEIEKQLFMWNPTLYSVVQWLFAAAEGGKE